MIDLRSMEKGTAKVERPSRTTDLAKLFKAAPSREREAALIAFVKRTSVTCIGIAKEEPGKITFQCGVPDPDAPPDQPRFMPAHYEWTYDLDTGILKAAKLIPLWQPSTQGGQP
jgi:hypothetical protein